MAVSHGVPAVTGDPKKRAGAKAPASLEAQRTGLVQSAQENEDLGRSARLPFENAHSTGRPGAPDSGKWLRNKRFAVPLDPLTEMLSD